MLTFREEFGEFFALRDGVVVASGDEARALYKAARLFEQQKARAKPGTLLTKTVKNDILTRRVESWL